MPSISNDLRVLLWVLAAIFSIFSAIIGNVLAINVFYFFTRRGRRPTRRPIRIWILFYLSATVSIGSGALAAFAPALPGDIENPSGSPQSITPTPYAPFSLNTWSIEYFSNIYLNAPSVYHTAQPATPNDEGGYTVKFKSFELRADPQIPQSNLSVRLSGLFYFDDGYYEFHCEHHDGCRVFIDGQIWVDAWWDGGGSHDLARDILAGNHLVSIEFYDKGGLGLLEVVWKLKAPISSTDTATPMETVQVPASTSMSDILVNPGEPVCILWEFNTNGDREGWQGNTGVKNLRVEGGALRGEFEQHDPSLFSPQQLNIDTSKYTALSIGYQITSDDTDGQMMWNPQSSQDFSSEMQILYGVISDGTWHTINIQLSDIASWSSVPTVNLLRLDSVHKALAGTFAYDYIRICG